MLQVKTFSAMTEKGLDKQVNEFLKTQDSFIEVVDVKFAGTGGAVCAMVLYKAYNQ